MTALLNSTTDPVFRNDYLPDWHLALNRALTPSRSDWKLKRDLIQKLTQCTYVRAKLDMTQPEDHDRLERLTNRQQQLNRAIVETEVALRQHDSSYAVKFPGGYFEPKSFEQSGDFYEYLAEGLDPQQHRLLTRRAFDQENKRFLYKTHRPSQYLTLLNANFNPDEPRDELTERLQACGCKKTLTNYNPNWPSQPRDHGEWAKSGGTAQGPTQIIPTSPNYDVNSVPPIPGMKVKYVPATKLLPIPSPPSQKKPTALQPKAHDIDAPSRVKDTPGRELKNDSDVKDGAVKLSHYGYPKDATPDENTKHRVGNHNNTLNKDSLAISQELADKYRLKVGDKVYINGVYIGNYDDTVPPTYKGRKLPPTIDVYDPAGKLGDSEKFGKVLPAGTRISNKP